MKKAKTESDSVTTTSRFAHDAQSLFLVLFGTDSVHDAVCDLIESFSIVEFVELVQCKLVVFVAFK